MAEVAQVRTYSPACIACIGRSLIIDLLGRRWINCETGTRSDVPHNMIYPLKDTRPNLHVLTGVHVKHVTFDACA